MPFQIPNTVDAFNADQAEPDSRDFGDIIVPAIDGKTGVVSGCFVTAQGSPDMTVAVSAGMVLVNGVAALVTVGNVTITTAHATLPRIDLICVDNTGTKSAVAGTAAADPVFPDPSAKVVLAAVYVPATDTTIATNQIISKRVIVRGEIIVLKPSDESVTSSTTMQDDDHLKFVVGALEVWEFMFFLRAAGALTGDIKIGFTVPTGTTMIWDQANGQGGVSISGTPASQIESSTINRGTDTTASILTLRGQVVTSTTPGTIQLRWAQNVIDAVPTTIKANSYVRALRIA